MKASYYHVQTRCQTCKERRAIYHTGKCWRCSPTFKRYHMRNLNFVWGQVKPIKDTNT